MERFDESGEGQSKEENEVNILAVAANQRRIFIVFLPVVVS